MGTQRSTPTPRPTNRPTSSRRQVYVGYNITGLDFDDLTDLDSTAEKTSFQTRTKAGMRDAFRDSDSNFNDLNGNSDPDKWTISINQMITNTVHLSGSELPFKSLKFESESLNALRIP